MSLPDVSSWLGPVATVFAAGAGAYVAGRLGQQTLERRRAIDRRQEAAESCIAALLSVRNLINDGTDSSNPKAWATVTGILYETLADCRFLMPKNMKHLARSVRMALGEAFGLLALGQDDTGLEVPDDDNGMWRRFALDYIDVAIDGMRRWRDSTQNASARVSVLNFDAWLSVTDRYQPIGGLAAWRGGRY